MADAEIMRVAVVVPRYGADIGGGAESQARGFAEEGVRRGWQVEVWTTCVRSHYTWENVYPEGTSRLNGVLVRRFPVHLRNLEQHGRLAVKLDARQRLSSIEQYKWLEGGAHSPRLYDHVARHAKGFDAVVVLPYASPLMNLAAWAAPERVIMWPCLHDEPYAYLEPTRLLLESVWGVMFNSPEERDLAVKQLMVEMQHHVVLGEGVTLAAHRPQTISISRDLLYVGRLEGGKNLILLYEYMQRYASEGGESRLIVVGSGPLQPPAHPAFEYRGFVSEEEKARAYTAALALCQPSLNESFSLTIMESWLAGRPVLVHGNCSVTRGHVQRSSGGLWFTSYDDFTGAIEWLRANEAGATQMGENGQQYVQSNYTWPSVVARFERLVKQWRGEQVDVAVEALG
ncbi:MAG: glycosyltransferase family 4 protein [Ardenticatenales bacterium]|nr:glycosyltransferase family 4 protein [Ardenticatenales bacterium]